MQWRLALQTCTCSRVRWKQVFRWSNARSCAGLTRPSCPCCPPAGSANRNRIRHDAVVHSRPITHTHTHWQKCGCGAVADTQPRRLAAHHLSREREREREMGLSQYCDGYHVLRFFGVRCLKRRHAQQLNEANRQAFIAPDL